MNGFDAVMVFAQSPALVLLLGSNKTLLSLMVLHVPFILPGLLCIPRAGGKRKHNRESQKEPYVARQPSHRLTTRLSCSLSFLIRG